MFNNPFSFNGRIRRREYIISTIIYGLLMAYLRKNMEAGDGISFLAAIPLIWFKLAQGAKRCHDRGNSGWFQIIPFYELWMLFGDSDYGLNYYGANPKEK